MKAIVLCAGRGTRLRPFTYSTAKHLIPVANKPVLFYGIEYLRALGIEDIGVVVSAESRPPIEAAVGDGRRWGVSVGYILQAEPRGLADATACAREFVGNDPFVLYLGDNILERGLAGLGAALDSDAEAAVMLKAAPNPSAFGIAEVVGDRIVNLVEKPSAPRSNLAITGGYVFRPSIFDAIAAIPPSARGEYEITDAIQYLISKGSIVRPCLLEGWWRDTGNATDVLDANRAVLEMLSPRIEGTVDSTSRIEGDVVIEPGAHVEASAILGPVIVGTGARIASATLGPHVAVGEAAVIAGCKVSDSVIMEGARLDGVARPLRRCLIGRNAVVEGSDAIELTVGDDCWVRG